MQVSKICVVGLGYVGLPLAIRFSEEGFKTIGFDIDPKKISFLNMGQSYIKHIDDKTISNILKTSFSPSIEFM